MAQNEEIIKQEARAMAEKLVKKVQHARVVHKECFYKCSQQFKKMSFGLFFSVLMC